MVVSLLDFRGLLNRLILVHLHLPALNPLPPMVIMIFMKDKNIPQIARGREKSLVLAKGNTDLIIVHLHLAMTRMAIQITMDIAIRAILKRFCLLTTSLWNTSVALLSRSAIRGIGRANARV